MLNRSPSIPDIHLSKLQRLRRFSHLLDNAIGIPGTKYRIGLDPLLGLIPGGGDFAGLAFSAYVVYEAAKLGIPHNTLRQMISNILLETVVGTIPVVGDFFDVTWKANTRNIRLLENHLHLAQSTRKTSWRSWLMIIVAFGLAIAGLIFLTTLILRWLTQLLT